jgi:Isochorismatase family
VGDRDVILNKPRYGGFHGIDLERVLRSAGVDTVIISGIATNICCETTPREAAQRDFHVYFLSDCSHEGAASLRPIRFTAEDRLWPFHLRRHAHHDAVGPAQYGHSIRLKTGPNPLGLIQTHSCPSEAQSSRKCCESASTTDAPKDPVSMPDRGDETWSRPSGPSSIAYPRSASGPYPGGCSTCQASPGAEG